MKYIGYVGLAACMVLIMLSGSVSAGEQWFSDVPVNHWAYGAVRSLSAAGIVRGFPDGSFRPGIKVSREQFAIVLVRTLNLPINDRAPQIFADIKPEHRSFGYIDATKSFIPVPSNPQGKFNFWPDRAITREEVAEALALALNLQKTGSGSLPKTFRDYRDISSEFRESVASAVYNNILSGKPGGRFDPQGPLTRAELCVALNSVIQRQKASEPEQPGETRPGETGPPQKHHVPWTVEFNFPQPDWDLVKCFYGTVVTKVYDSEASYMVLENSLIENSGSSVRIVSKSVNMYVYRQDLDRFFIGDVLLVNYDRKNNITSYRLEHAAGPHPFLPQPGTAQQYEDT